MAILNMCILVVFLVPLIGGVTAKSGTPMSFPRTDSPERLRRVGDICATNCTCKTAMDVVFVNCTFRDLRSVPDDLPANTEVLLLSDNRIDKLGSKAFRGLSNLKFLDLAYNQLAEIDGDAFNGLHQLQTLYINSNKPAGNVTTFPVGAFKETIELKTLCMHEVKALRSYSSAHDFKELIGSIRTLKNLTISVYPHNWREVFDTLSTLVHLEQLQVYCMEIQVTNYTFDAFSESNIKQLKMQCIEEDLPNSTFSFFSHLDMLDLSNNMYSDSNDISRFWPGLAKTNISNLQLAKIFMKPTKLEESFYSGLQETRLDRLNLDYNFIIFLGKYLWLVKYLPYLEYLSFKDNRLFIPDDMYYYLRCHQHLKYLNLNQAVWLMSSFFEPVANSSEHVCSQAPLLKEVGDNKFSDKVIQVVLPDSLSHILMPGEGYLAGVTTQLSVTVSRELKYFKSENGYLRGLNSILKVGDQKPLFKIKLHLINNQFNYIEDEFGESAGNVTDGLFLSYNELGAQISSDSTGKTFGKFTELATLYLNYNMIKNLHKDVFRAQRKLKVLNLAQNNLQLLEFSFQHMNLTHLDLAGNLFSQLSEENCRDLDDLAEKVNHTLFLSLTENPLQCSCETLHFLQWILDTKIQWTDWQYMTCLYKGRVVNLLNSTIIPELNVTCRSKTWLIASSLTLGLTLLLIAISVVLYRHRFEVRYALLNLVIKRKKYDALNEEEDYSYDAFVAFDKADVDWVSDVLLPKLEQEGEHRFHLCVHQRDFTGGTPIIENIADAICSSRKVIVILTKNFLASSWCQFELETTQIRSFEEGKDLIIPVLMEDLPVSSMSKTLRVLLQRNTYIMWPEHDQEQSQFWITLRRALSSRPSKIIRCQCGNNINL